MSISLLKDNTLWADNVGQDNSSYPHTISQMKKLFISDRGDVAFTVIGDALKDSGKEEYIKQAMRRIHSYADKLNTDQTQTQRNLFISRGTTIMTATETYYMNGFEVLNIQGDLAAWGDNRMSVLTAIHMGKSPRKAIEVALEICYGFKSDFPIDSVKQSSLKPLDLDYYLLDKEEA